eukprot:5143092-Amphidinium_carterae.2
MWPLAKVNIAAVTYYALDANATPSLMSVFDVSTYEAFTLTWRGPFALQASHPKAKLSSPHVLGCPNTPPQTLLAVAAMHGFWSMSRTAVVSIARHLKIQIEDSSSDSSLVCCLESLFKHYHPKASNDMLSKALRHRLPIATPQDEWLHHDCCEDMLEQSDCADLHNCRKSSTASKPDHQSIENRLQSLRSSKKPSKSTSSVAASSGQGTITDGGRTYPAKVVKPTNAISQSAAAQLLPVGFRYDADRNNQRWLVTSPFGSSRSYSYNKYGYNIGCRLMLLEAWSLNESMGGMSMPYDLPEW